MRTKYEEDLKKISDKLVVMCRCIEAAVEKCVRALEERDLELAQEVLEEDDRIDRLERKIAKSCYRLMVMQQPVASDFRKVVTALKMITDLERIGDQARDIAEISMKFESEWYVKKMGSISQMAIVVIQMVRDSVQAYINRDVELARSLDSVDDKVDELFDTAKLEIISAIKENPSNTEQAMMLMMIAKYLERIGDHAVNVGEWVEYAKTGKTPNNLK